MRLAVARALSSQDLQFESETAQNLHELADSRTSRPRFKRTRFPVTRAGWGYLVTRAVWGYPGQSVNRAVVVPTGR